MFGKVFEEKYNFLKVLKVDVIVSKKTCTIFFIYPETIKEITEDNRQEIKNLISEYLNINFKIIVNFKKSFLEENLINNEIVNYISKSYHSVNCLYKPNDLEIIKENINFITINQKIGKSLLKTINEEEYSNNLKNYLENNFCAEFNVNIIEKEDEILDSFIKETIIPKQKKVIKRFEVYNTKKLFGEDDIPSFPEYIGNINSEKENVILAGKILNFERKEFIKKKNRELENPPKNIYIKFTLSDNYNKISCIYFSTKTNEKKLLELKDGMEVLLKGNVKSFNNKFDYTIKSIYFCELNKKIEKENNISLKENILNNKDIKQLDNIIDNEISSTIYRNQEITTYKRIKPEIYHSNIQSNLFVQNVTKEIFKNKEFVVFDLETTGLNFNTDEIIEIGAVKIKNGIITETFETLIKPKNPIPVEATKVNNITNEMVKNSPNLEDVLDDFYFFSKGCVLVAYNINFDYSFINFYGKQNGLLFDNEQVDALAVARNKLFLKNYKLSTVVKYLNIELIGAHRAINDTIATAKAFIELYE